MASPDATITELLTWGTTPDGQESASLHGFRSGDSQGQPDSTAERGVRVTMATRKTTGDGGVFMAEAEYF